MYVQIGVNNFKYQWMDIYEIIKVSDKKSKGNHEK